jgi:hypothetical protein
MKEFLMNYKNRISRLKINKSKGIGIERRNYQLPNSASHLII